MWDECKKNTDFTMDNDDRRSFKREYQKQKRTIIIIIFLDFGRERYQFLNFFGSWGSSFLFSGFLSKECVYFSHTGSIWWKGKHTWDESNWYYRRNVGSVIHGPAYVHGRIYKDENGVFYKVQSKVASWKSKNPILKTEYQVHVWT